MSDEFEGQSYLAIGKRLRISREAWTALNESGMSQTAFSKRAGIGLTAYNQYESGRQRPSLANARKLRKAFGFTLDWIYEGDMSGLRYDLAEKIRIARMGAREPKKRQQKGPQPALITE